jgi:hypothetical protein
MRGPGRVHAGEVGGADLALEVAGVEPGEHAGEGGGGEAVVAGQERRRIQ